MAPRPWPIIALVLFTSMTLVLPIFIPALGDAIDQGGPSPRSGSRINSVPGTLYGFVTDLGGTPIQNVKLTMEAMNGTGFKRTTLSQAGGYYTENLPENGWQVTVEKVGYFTQSTTIKIYSGETTRHDFNLEQIPPVNCQLHGKITNEANGNPIFNASVFVMDAVRTYSTNTTTGILGNYNLNLYAGDFILIVSKLGFLPKFMGGVHLNSGETKTIDMSIYPQPAMDARMVGDITFQYKNGSTGPARDATFMVFDPVKSFLTFAEADHNGHYDFNLYPAKFSVLVQAVNSTILDSAAVNVTTIASQVVTQNVKLTEMPPAKMFSRVNITKWDKQHFMQNMTMWGRSGSGGSGSVRSMRFMFDLFFGNGDQYLTSQEVQVYTDMWARDIRNSMGLYDTRNIMTIDGVDFIFNKDLDSYSIDMSGSVFGNKPMYMQLDIGLTTNGTINDKVPVHHVWLNQSYASGDQTEENYIDFQNIFTIKNITTVSTMQVSQTGNTSLHVVAGPNPDPKSTERSANITFELVDRILPVVKVGPDRAVNEDSDVVFDGSASTDNFGLLYYVWDFGDGASKNSTTTTAVHNYPNPGNYVVKLKVIDLVHLEATAKMNLTVNDTTAPKVSIEVNKTTVNEDTIVHFKANASDNVAVANINWWMGNTHLGNGTNLSYEFDAPGMYTVSVNVTDTSGLKAQSLVAMTIRDVTPPSAAPGQNRTVNESVEVRFNGAGSYDNVGIVMYAWSFGDGSSNVTGSGTINPTHTYVRPGNYTVTLNVTDAAGHWDKKSLWVLVRDITLPEASAHASKASALVKKTVQFNSTGSKDNVGIVSYKWDFGDGITGNGPSAEHKYKKAGTFTVNLTVEDAAGLKATSSIKITVEEPQNPYLNAVCIGSLFAIVFVAGIGAYLAYKRIRLGGYKIEEAFVIYGDGRLIKHISAHKTETADKEIIAAMLTAVQDFVKDSLKKEGEFLGKLEFGKKTKILIERGKDIYLAIVLSGHDPESLRNTLAKTVKEVEERYRKALSKWDGNTGAFKGLDEMVIELIEK